METEAELGWRRVSARISKSRAEQDRGSGAKGKSSGRSGSSDKSFRAGVIINQDTEARTW